MNNNHFGTRLRKQLMPNIQPNSVTITDNAPYHSVKVKKVLTTAIRKKTFKTGRCEKTFNGQKAR